jgi:hypothetical protein
MRYSYCSLPDIPHGGADLGAYASVTPGIPMSQALAQVLVLVRQVAPDGPWSRAVSPMHPDPGVAHPSCGRVLEAVALVVRNWCRMRREDLAKPRLQGRLHPPADGQHQQPRPEACRRVASACSGQHLRVWPEATPTCRLGWACIPSSPLRRGAEGVVECLGGADDTPLWVDTGLTRGDPPGERTGEPRDALVRWGAWAWAPPLVSAGGRADGARGHDGGRPARRPGRQGRRRRSGTGRGRAAPCLERGDVRRTGLPPLLVPGVRRLRRARRGVEAHPAWLDATSARSHHRITSVRRERRHRRRIGLGPDRLGCAHGGGDPGEPRHPRRGALRTVRGPREGRIGDPASRASGERPRRPRVGAERADVWRGTLMPPAGRHQHGHAGLGFDPHVPPHRVAVRSRLPTRAAGAVPDGRIRLRVTVVAPLDLEPGTIARPHAGRTSPARHRGRRQAAGACGHPRGRAGLQRPTEGVLVARLGSHAGRHASGGGLVRQDARHEGARLGETPPAIPHQRCDGFPDGEVPPCRVVVGGVVADGTIAECGDQARDQAEMVQQWAPGRGVVGQHHRRGR